MARGKFEHWLTEDGLTILEGWARDGLTDEQIAHNIGITTKTLYEWKNRFSSICEALKKGKEVVDYEVENALLKRAMGYAYEEDRVVDGEIVTVKKVVPPDTTAQIFWLKNRRPDKWRDKPADRAENETDVEDLAPLADMLNNDKNTDNPLGAAE